MEKKKETKKENIWTDDMTYEVFVFQPALSSKNELYGKPCRPNASLPKVRKINNNPNKFG